MLISQGFSVTFSPLNSMQMGEQGTLYMVRGGEGSDTDLHQRGLAIGMMVTMVSCQAQPIIQVLGDEICIPADLAHRLVVRLGPTCPVTYRSSLWGNLAATLRSWRSWLLPPPVRRSAPEFSSPNV